jgi:integrase
MAVKDGITRRGDAWYVVLREPDPATGKTKMVWHSGFDSEDEAKAFRDNRRVKLRSGSAIRKDTLTVSDYMDLWLPAHAATKDLKPSTVFYYEEKINLYIKPRIGGTRLQLLTPSQVQGMYMDLLGAGLSRRTVEMVGTILRMTLKHAVIQYRFIESNPAENIPIPRPRKKEVLTWTAAEMRLILDVVSNDRYGALFYTQAMTGARGGELLGLRWNDVDLDEGVIWFHVNRVRLGSKYAEGTLKNDQGKKVSIDNATIVFLRAHRKRQAADKLKSRKWLDDQYVFCNMNGGPMNQGNLNRYWHEILKKAGVRYQKPHALRHTHATLLLEAGEGLHVVAQRLGHKDAMVTATIYAHVTPKQSRQAADTFTRILDI